MSVPTPEAVAYSSVYSSPSLDVVARRLGPVTIVTVVGDVDLVTAGALTDCLRAEFDPRPRDLVVDLREVTFFGSQGVRAVLVAAGGDQTVLHLGVGDNRGVARILQITGLDTVVDVRSDVEGLVSSLRG